MIDSLRATTDGAGRWPSCRRMDSFLTAVSERSPSQPPSAASYTQDDCTELLECARYGEEDDIETMRALLQQGVPINFADDGGNTALHKASANGHVAIVKLLAAAGAAHTPNASGNYPLHWAVQQGQHEAAQALLEAYADIDVLAQNGFGRSASTEAFAKNDARLVELVLQHPSAKKLEPAVGVADDDDGAGGMDDAEAEVTHAFEFTSGGPTVQLRELAHIGSDEISRVLGASPEEDKTGLQLWAASLVLSHWLLDLREQICGRAVLELGAGCGLCGIVAAKLSASGPVLLTDLAPPTVANMEHNIAINSLQAPAVRAAVLDWREPKTWPPAHPVVIGADLVYAREAVSDLLRVVGALVAPGGCFLYVAPETNRAGETDFLQGLTTAGFECQVSAVPAGYLRCILPERSEEDFEILFAELRERTYSLCANDALRRRTRTDCPRILPAPSPALGDPPQLPLQLLLFFPELHGQGHRPAQSRAGDGCVVTMSQHVRYGTRRSMGLALAASRRRRTSFIATHWFNRCSLPCAVWHSAVMPACAQSLVTAATPYCQCYGARSTVVRASIWVRAACALALVRTRGRRGGRSAGGGRGTAPPHARRHSAQGTADIATGRATQGTDTGEADPVCGGAVWSAVWVCESETLVRRRHLTR